MSKVREHLWSVSPRTAGPASNPCQQPPASNPRRAGGAAGGWLGWAGRGRLAGMGGMIGRAPSARLCVIDPALRDR